jgi:hypothetical protein
MEELNRSKYEGSWVSSQKEYPDAVGGGKCYINLNQIIDQEQKTF